MATSSFGKVMGTVAAVAVVAVIGYLGWIYFTTTPEQRDAALEQVLEDRRAQRNPVVTPASAPSTTTDADKARAVIAETGAPAESPAKSDAQKAAEAVSGGSPATPAAPTPAPQPVATAPAAAAAPAATPAPQAQSGMHVPKARGKCDDGFTEYDVAPFCRKMYAAVKPPAKAEACKPGTKREVPDPTRPGMVLFQECGGIAKKS